MKTFSSQSKQNVKPWRRLLDYPSIKINNSVQTVKGYIINLHWYGHTISHFKIPNTIFHWIDPQTIPEHTIPYHMPNHTKPYQTLPNHIQNQYCSFPKEAGFPKSRFVTKSHLNSLFRTMTRQHWMYYGLLVVHK